MAAARDGLEHSVWSAALALRRRRCARCRCDRREGRRARRCDAEMRSNISVRINLQRGKRFNRSPRGRPRAHLESGEEKLDVDRKPIHFIVSRHDEERDTRSCDGWPERRHTAPGQTAKARVPETADESIPVRAAAVLRSAWRLSEVVVGILVGRVLPSRPGAAGPQDLPYVRRILSIIADVEYPSASGIRTTRPPRDSTV